LNQPPCTTVERRPSRLMNLTSGVANEFTPAGIWTPREIDLIELDSVRWDDGTYEGRPQFPHLDALIESNSGGRLQLRRIVDALRAVLANRGGGLDLLASATAAIDRLPEAESDQLKAASLAMQSTKATVRADIVRFAENRSTPADDAVREWLTSLLNRYEARLVRLSPP